MAKKYSLEYIKKIFGPVIYKRGKELYQNSAVSNVIDSGDKIMATVDSESSNKKYAVVIGLDLKDDIISIDCTCPFTSNCKHAAAALLFYNNHGAHITKERIVPNPLDEYNKSFVEKEERVDILPSKNKNSYLIQKLKKLETSLQTEKKENFNNNQTKLSDKKERWKVVFVIQKNVGSRYDDFGGYMVLSLGLSYIKKDGTEGRIADFREDKLTEAFSNETELKLYNILINKKYYSATIESFFEFLLENRDIPLYYYFFEDHYRVIFKEFDKLVIDFEFTKLDYNKIPEFESKLTVKDKEDKVWRIITGILEISFDYVILFTPGGEIFYKRTNILFPNFVFNLFKSRSFYKNEIDDIKKFINKYLQDDVECIFTREKIVYRVAKAKPTIEMPETFLNHNVVFSLGFDYENDEVSTLPTPNEENSIYITFVDREFENQVTDYLHYKLKEVEDSIHSRWNGPNTFTLKISYREFLIKYGVSLVDEGFEIKFEKSKKKITSSKGKVKISVSSGIDWFDIKSSYITEDNEELKIEITEDILKSGLIVNDNKFVILSKEDIEILSKVHNEGVSDSGKLRISKLNFGVIDSLYDVISNNDIDEIKFARDMIQKLKNFEEIKKEDLPQKFNGTLRDYQKSGYNWLHFLNKYNLNGCLADDMGLGKTIQTLAFLQSLKEKNNLGLTLLIVPVTTVANWVNEISKFTPELKFIRHYGQERVKEKDFFNDYDIVISSYHTLRNDLLFFKDFEFDYMILDEAQNIKNHTSKIFKTVKLIKSKHRLSLTGTPIENNTTELWSLFNFLNPSLLGSINNFKNRFVTPIEVNKDKSASERLKKSIYPFILRRKKGDVLKDLPDKEEIIVYCEMDSKQRGVYESLNDYYKKEIGSMIDEKGVEKSTVHIFDALLRLRQAALFPSLVSDKFKDVESTKFETLKDLIEDVIEEKHKMLLFSQFVKSLKIIEDDIKSKKLNYSYIDGQTKKRDVEIKKFQEDENINIFLLSLKAGGVGINLTAADYVILFDPWWNPAIESQAVDRSHRIGQTKKVMVYKLIVKDTIEEKILELQNKKKELVNQLITEEASFFKSLSKNDIMNLFN